MDPPVTEDPVEDPPAVPPEIEKWFENWKVTSGSESSWSLMPYVTAVASAGTSQSNWPKVLSMDSSMLLVLLRCRCERLGYLTCDEACGVIKSYVARALHEAKGDWACRGGWFPLDGVSSAGLDNFVRCWCSDHVKASDLSGNAGGGGQCQKAGLDKCVLHS